jgi:ribosomal-protein-alanine N-acetyltransferase
MREKDNRAYVVIRKDTNEIVGVVELRDIYLGDFSNAYACWYAFANQTGHGFMRTALQEVIQIAFNKLRLHRLEANIQPENKSSIILAKACGFKKEGYSPKFLRKNGEWCDHERWAILNPND